MVGPLVLLAIGAGLSGLVGIPGALFERPELNLLGHAFEPVLGPEMEIPHNIEWIFMAVSTALAATGIGLAWVFYGGGYREPAHRVAFQFPRFVALVRDKFRIDELYDAVLIRPLRRLSQLLYLFIDRILIDKILVEGLGAVVDVVGRMARFLQMGDAQRYMAVFAIGAAALVFFASRPPIPSELKVSVEGLNVQVDARRPGRTSGRDLEYSFDFDDGREEAQKAPEAHHVYRQPGRYTIKVTVTDPKWRTSTQIKRRVEVQ
jgi:hypothetical protein